MAFVAALLVAASAAAAAAAAAAAPSPPSSIIFILADDLGYNEMAFNNNSRGLLTPNLDRLAAGGARLTSYYTNPLCSPTRSALMTGKYNHRLGTQANVVYWDTPWAVPLEHAFLPQRLKAIPGFGSTAMYGKWHLGMHDQRFWPANRGFDDHSGYFQGCGGYGSHVAACCDAPSPNASDFSHYLCASGEPDYRGYDWFANLAPQLQYNGTSSSEAIAGLAEAAIARYTAASAAPFFLYLPFQNIHAPYDAAWDSVQRAAAAAPGLSPQQQQMFGYIYELDAAIGRVVAALDKAAVLQDSLIIFVSDNGAPAAPGVEARNYPLRGFKSDTYEGGTRVPGLVYAPGRVPAGGALHSMIHVTDWVPTLVEAAGGALGPEEGLDGVSQWAALTASAPLPTPPRSEIVYNINPLCKGGQFGTPKAALRVGDMKLLCFCFSIAGIDNETETRCQGDPQNPGAWPKLYNISADIGEAVDLAAEQPAVVRALEARLIALAGASVEPMQWVPPYQGKDYYCRNCPLRPQTGPYVPWDAWITTPPPPGAGEEHTKV